MNTNRFTTWIARSARRMMNEHRNLIVFCLMLVIVPLAGEPKIHPFAGELSSFRVSFGSPIFLLFLLWMRNTSFILSGFCTGLSVMIFRMGLDLLLNDISFSSSILLRGPTFFYYFVYAACFHLPKTDALYQKALQIALWSILAEFIASIAELGVTNLCVGSELVITLPVLVKIALIAVIRCFFILSFFFLNQLYQTETRANHQRRQTKRMLLLIANLYEEVVQLSKSQKNAEEVTRNCYKIYEKLQDETAPINRARLAAELLEIAGQVHEIKKDNQRIYAGLNQLTNDRKLNDYMPPRELAEIIVQSNKKYARSLAKHIAFTQSVDRRLPNLHVYTVLSLVNNLAANAVEAIKSSGAIDIAFLQEQDFIVFRVSDDGVGIPPNKLKLLFKPGYTTKFDAAGNPSTGVGLPYVKHLAGELGGAVDISRAMERTIFTITIPLAKLKG